MLHLDVEYKTTLAHLALIPPLPQLPLVLSQLSSTQPAWPAFGRLAQTPHTHSQTPHQSLSMSLITITASPSSLSDLAPSSQVTTTSLTPAHRPSTSSGTLRIMASFFPKRPTMLQRLSLQLKGRTAVKPSPGSNWRWKLRLPLGRSSKKISYQL